MGDMGDDFNAMRAHKQARHAEWKQKNIETLLRSSHTLTINNNEETVLFREAGKPKVDFYPSTGRWRVVGATKTFPTRTFRGGASNFLQWYEKQFTEVGPCE